MKSKLIPTLALSALVVAMSATSANASLFPKVDAVREKFRTNVENFFQKKQNGQIKVYAVSKGKGTYGEILAQKGWKLDYTTNFSSIPNQATTIVYVNVADPEIKWAELANFFANFDGVIVIDSLQTAVSSKSNLGYELLKKGPELAESYNKLLAQSTRVIQGHAVVGSAVIVSMRIKRVLPLYVDDRMSVNGFEVSQQDDFINLKSFVYNNKNLPVPNAGGSSARTGSQNTTSEMVGDIFFEKDGIYSIAQAYVHAFRQELNTGGYIWKTQTIIVSGDSQDACRVNGVKCGVYAKNNDSLITIIPTTDPKKVSVASYFTHFGAHVTSWGAKSLTGFFPDKEGWGNDERREDDVTTETYTQSGSIGIDVDFKRGKIPNIPGVLKPSTGRSLTVTKVTKSWGGWGYETSEDYPYRAYGGSDPILKKRKVLSGVELLPDKRYEANDVLVSDGNVIQSFMKVQLEAQDPKLPDRVYRCSTWERNDYNRTNRASMTYKGWQPSIMATHEYVDGTESFPTGIALLFKPMSSYIVIDAGLSWGRARDDYHVLDESCRKSKGLFFRWDPVTYKMYSKDLTNTTNQARLNKKYYLYSNSIQFKVYHRLFK